MMLLFTAHAILWWGWSAAATYGWAINSDFNIVRNLQGFSFILGLPIFNAVIMGDPVIRDFRIGVDPLIFSKPISRTSYLLGKFFGNFFVLVCCQSAFVLTTMLLQWVPLSRLVVHQYRVWPYFKHFFFFVVVSHLILAIIYFTVGTLTRNPKIVYVLAVGFYPAYIAWQIFFLKSLPEKWRIILDPMLLAANGIPRDKWTDAAWINQIVVTYSAEMVMNRALMVAAVVFCLTVLCVRFSIVERSRDQGSFALLDLSNSAELVQASRETTISGSSTSGSVVLLKSKTQAVPIPAVERVNKGVYANLRKLVAATQIELHLLRSERSLIVIVPLAIILSFLALPFSTGHSAVSPSAAFAGSAVRGLLIFLAGIVVFYTGEAMHREREIRVGAILWGTPAGNNVFLLSKFLATLLLTALLLLLSALTAMLTQFLRGQTPVEVFTYFSTYSVILVPGLAFIAAACIAINVLLRAKYEAYALIIAISAVLFYLYTQGYNHWLYNPLLWGLWSEEDLVRISSTLLFRGVYWLALMLICLLAANRYFERRSLR